MNARQTIAAAGLSALLAGPTYASGLEPIQAQSIDLTGISGTAYYTIEADGFHVVTTLAHKRGGNVPVRVLTVLVSGQCVSFSTPGVARTVADSIEVCREGDQVFVQKDQNLN